MRGIGGALGALAVLLCCAAGTAPADEGMWPLDGPMPKAMREIHAFEPSAAWLEHVRKSCVRFSSGGSGAFVSADGLVMTNHHVGSDELSKASTPTRDLLATGFLARTRAEEMPCKELELFALWSTEDVTARVRTAGAAAKTPAEAEAARRRESTRIEQEAVDATGLHGQVVAFYGGARYVLHRYRRWTDVRLVMAPEQAAAFFGGDVDNFEYPRHDLDVCFFRVYEGGKPLRPEHHLAWSAAGAKEGDLTFVAGHPWRTQRLFTADHLRYLRDVELPFGLRRSTRWEVALQTFVSRGEEASRIGSADLLEVQNGRKWRTGLLEGLQDPALIARKEAEDLRLRAASAAASPPRPGDGEAWASVARTLAAARALHERNVLLAEGSAFGGSQLARVAVHLVRLADEGARPNEERLREYRESERESLLREVLSPAPVYDDLEVARLSVGLSFLCEVLGADDPVVRKALAGLSPRARAEALVRGSSLRDVAVRRALVEGGREAIAASKDPLVRFAADLDPDARAVRRRWEDEVESVQNEAYAQVAAARFASLGAAAYPDATYTLRLSYGDVRGYREDGRDVPPFTTLRGAFRRMEERKGVPPFALPKSWLEGRPRLALDTPYNFVTTADIVGGNSGSPVTNRAGEVVGIVFDGNLQGLVLDLVYTDEQARCVCVDSRAIVECLRVLYGASGLVDELTKR